MCSKEGLSVIPAGAPALLPAVLPAETSRKPASSKETPEGAAVPLVMSTGKLLPQVPGKPPISVVNSKRFRLNYVIKEEGPTGISTIELWYTQDGHTWQAWNQDRDRRSPYAVEVAREGRYGFTLVVRNGVGLGGRTPQNGDQPQIWVEVDQTKPVVRLLDVKVVPDKDTLRLAITWSASDRNLACRPITLAYATHAEGPWTPIAAEVENTGSYLWQMPPRIPGEFYIRVQASDLAGNVGSEQTPHPVRVNLAQSKGGLLQVDLPQPKGVILRVEPEPGEMLRELKAQKPGS